MLLRVFTILCLQFFYTSRIYNFVILTFSEFLEEKKNPCWRGYKQLGTKKKNRRPVPNCVKVNENQEEFDRAAFYLEYYKNLSPTGFSLERYGDLIVIRVPQATEENHLL